MISKALKLSTLKNAVLEADRGKKRYLICRQLIEMVHFATLLNGKRYLYR